MNTGLGGLNRIKLIVNGTGRAGQVVNLVDFDVQWKGNVMANQLETRVAKQWNHVVPVASEEVVNTQNIVTTFKQGLAKMGAKKT